MVFKFGFNESALFLKKRSTRKRKVEMKQPVHRTLTLSSSPNTHEEKKKDGGEDFKNISLHIKAEKSLTNTTSLAINKPIFFNINVYIFFFV